MEHMNKRTSLTVPNIDRISDLPESILAHILSFLCIKNAVATSILSQRWSSLWTLTSNLEFSSYDIHRTRYSSSRFMTIFINVVNYVLLLHKPAHLNRFSLAIARESDHVKVGTWISAWISVVIAKNLQELCLQTSKLPIHAQRSIFSYQGLISLELDCNMCLSSEIVVSFPRLERLQLISVYFLDEEALNKLIAGCPVLKYLMIEMDFGKMKERLGINVWTHHVFRWKISSNSLARVKVSLPPYDTYAPSVGTFLCIQLDTPLLEYFKIKRSIYNIFIQQKSLPSLVKVSIQLAPLVSESELQYSFNSVVETFHSFDCAKKTPSKPFESYWTFSRVTIKMRTKFKSLTELKSVMDSPDWSPLLDVIGLLDSLEALSIHKCYSNDDVDDINLNWKQPDSVPSCLSKSLRTVTFRQYDGYHHELPIIAYILKLGSVLQLIRVYFEESILRDFKTKFELVQKISKFPRASPVCEVHFV